MPEQLGEYRRIAVLGGVYSNALSLEATLADARARDVEAVFCLGDMGGFGPRPNRVFPLLRDPDWNVQEKNRLRSSFS